jgi:hypothetical protein
VRLDVGGLEIPFLKKIYAIAIVHPDGRKLLFGRVRRSAKGEVFAVWAEDQSPRNLGRGSNPHASYHANGRLHSKSHGIIAIKKTRQVPNASFKGTEPIEATNADRGLSPTLPVLSGYFDDVFEIKSGQIASSRNPSITVDVSEPGVLPIRQTGSDQVIAEKIFKDDTPWIIVSLVESPGATDVE